MYKQILYALTMTAVLLAQGRTRAAYGIEYLMTVKVPFAFQINDKTLAAGEYVIKRDPQIPHVLTIQGRATSVMTNAQPLELTGKTQPSALVFHDYSGQRFLSEVRVSGGSVKYALFPSKAESRLAQTAKAKTISAPPNGQMTSH